MAVRSSPGQLAGDKKKTFSPTYNQILPINISKNSPTIVHKPNGSYHSIDVCQEKKLKKYKFIYLFRIARQNTNTKTDLIQKFKIHNFTVVYKLLFGQYSKQRRQGDYFTISTIPLQNKQSQHLFFRKKQYILVYNSVS